MCCATSDGSISYENVIELNYFVEKHNRYAPLTLMMDHPRKKKINLQKSHDYQKNLSLKQPNENQLTNRQLIYNK